MHTFKIGDIVTIKHDQMHDSLRGLAEPFTVVCASSGGSYLMVDVQDRNGVIKTGIFARRFELVDREVVLRSTAGMGLIDAIKHYRQKTGADLLESKRTVEEFRSAAPARASVAKHWFIAVLDKGDNQPRPNSPPRCYTSAEQARAVAYSMAEKNRSETFVVYEATDVVLAPPVTLPETQHQKL